MKRLILSNTLAISVISLWLGLQMTGLDRHVPPVGSTIAGALFLVGAVIDLGKYIFGRLDKESYQ